MSEHCKSCPNRCPDPEKHVKDSRAEAWGCALIFVVLILCVTAVKIAEVMAG